MGTREAALVGTDWLGARIGDPRLRVVEVDVSPAAYNEGHIQDAVLWNVYSDLKDADYRTVDTAAVERLLERSGIAEDTTVVFYGYAPALGFWFMKLYGHRDVRILDCGREALRERGVPWTTVAAEAAEAAVVVAAEPVRYPLGEPDPGIQVRLPEVRAAIDDGKRTLVDVRSEAEFRGERFWPSGGQQEGGRAGRVPTAVHVPLDGLYDDAGAFRDAAALRQVFAPLDLAGRDELITYCTIGGRASTAWFVLTYLLERPAVRVYDGSWAEWGMTPTAPVAVG